MAQTLQRCSAALFFITGSLTLLLMVLLKKDIATTTVEPILYSLDLPLLLSGMLYGGASLYVSLTRDGRPSLPKALLIGLPLLALFCFFAYLNFALPFAE